MRVPIEWLREHVDVPAGATGLQVAADLVKIGLEEEAIHGGGITGPLVVGRVLTKEPEEQKNGKVINWCSVDVGDANGTGEPQGIVCGAHNFDAGDTVVVVLPGAVLPGGFAISARKTYGHLSAGMICAADELGLPDDGSHGIILLPQRLGVEASDLTPGQDALPLLGLDRETVEVNVTPDRGYCFSIRGVAREYGHSTGARFTDPVLDLNERAPEANASGYPVRVDDDAPLRGNVGCDRYVARIVRGVDPAAPVPAWLSQAVTEAGMRSISLPVDITNYVMLGLGQPLHAFDLATLGDEIVVRRALAGEEITTLDDVERTLFAEDLLITDGGERPLAIAGVMGGAESEVSDTTSDILIEAAHFDPVSIARSARRHRLSSEASKRFERGVDPAIAAAAAQLAVDLLVQYGGGRVDDGVTDLDTVAPAAPIAFDPQQPTRLVGVSYSDDEVEASLTAVGCVVERVEEARWNVTAPSWRPDLTTGPDLVEEVARLRGYDQIPSVLARPVAGRGLTASQRYRRTVANALAAQGLSEIISLPFVSDELHTKLRYGADDTRRSTVRLSNPLSDEAPLLRTSVLSTMLESLKRNIARGFKDVGLFELGLVVAGPAGTAPTERVGVHPTPEVLAAIRDAVPAQPRHVAWVMTGDGERKGWWGAGRSSDWSDAVATALGIGRVLGVQLEVAQADVAPFHPGRCAQIMLPDGSVIGHAGELHPKVLTTLGLPPRVVAGELDLDALSAFAERTGVAEPIATYPQAHSDVALVVDSGVTAAVVEDALHRGGGENLESLALFDIYEGEQVGEGKKSLAYRLFFRSPERTLTTEEVNVARDAAVREVDKAVGASLRGA
ncbi:phenylalanine--tRNA ligase subunit beta [Dermacoccus barathri]|uniref:phenylalanine--tRNA ligase subunit beta n=1 Tax=Dermacoccus barathri TaxID=322601 RepID=UPI00187A2FD7|nr:phenylalanine--tRNA ligase subunit beta [Dermacoccus barathri]MBE7371227.1 phenylalanine--tRNA ligase subunit beta [Dermacoccus barathri]